MNWFKKDSLLLGLSLSLITPLIVYVILSFLVGKMSAVLTNGIPLIREHNIILVSIFLNMIIFHRFIHKDKYDMAGRGVMVVTFVMTIIYFVWRFTDFIG